MSRTGGCHATEVKVPCEEVRRWSKHLQLRPAVRSDFRPFSLSQGRDPIQVAHPIIYIYIITIQCLIVYNRFHILQHSNIYSNQHLPLTDPRCRSNLEKCPPSNNHGSGTIDSWKAIHPYVSCTRTVKPSCLDHMTLGHGPAWRVHLPSEYANLHFWREIWLWVTWVHLA